MENKHRAMGEKLHNLKVDKEQIMIIITIVSDIVSLVQKKTFLK